MEQGLDSGPFTPSHKIHHSLARSIEGKAKLHAF